MFKSCMQPVATVLDRVDVEHFPQCRQFRTDPGPLYMRNSAVTWVRTQAPRVNRFGLETYPSYY